VKVGAGTLILNGNSDFTGGTYLNEGTLGVGSNSALGTGPLTVYGGAVRGDAAPHTISNAVNLFVTGVVTGSADLTLVGPITGAFGLTKNGTGTLTLSGHNTFSGNIVVNDGTLAVGSNDALSSGTLRFNGGGIRSDSGPRTVFNVIGLVATATVTGSDDLTLFNSICGTLPTLIPRIAGVMAYWASGAIPNKRSVLPSRSP
jgi:autotransporter-associated beta strand protein